jgi:hypothetical protein
MSNTDKPCACEIHIREESKEPEKKWIECIGHGIGCPCTEKQTQASSTPETPTE